MIEVTFAIAILLAGGILFAKGAQLFNLPSVTGFILAGLILGPSGFSLITAESVGDNLDHFTQIALMLIAFGVGEHVEVRRLGGLAKQVLSICLTQALVCLLTVIPAVILVAAYISPEIELLRHIVQAILLGAVALAGAPAAILHLVRENNARGPLTSTLMAVIALGDALAVVIFGIALSIAHQLVSPGTTSLWSGIIGSFTEISGSLFMGILTGLLIDFALHKTHKRGEMLTAGLALLLLCGEITHMMGLSPLLAGMTAGCITVNREERDVRLFRILNGFEPPVYVLFFTLAGVHLDLALLQHAGWVGITYFLARICGRYTGSRIGARLSRAPETVRLYLGPGLIPQAGMAIGLVFVITSDPLLDQWSQNITPVVLAGVVLSELLGPILAGKALVDSGETTSRHPQIQDGRKINRLAHLLFSRSDELRLPPWSWKIFEPAEQTRGVVIFGSAHYATVRGLARVAAILAHHFHALPMSVRIIPPDDGHQHAQTSVDSLFLPESDEIKSLGFPLLTQSRHGKAVEGLIQAAGDHDTKALVLGYPLGKNPLAIQKIIDKVAVRVSCPVVAVRFIGSFSCDSILVPFVELDELPLLLPILEAMVKARQSEITMMQLCDPEFTRIELRDREKELAQWLKINLPEGNTVPLAVAAGSRLEAVLTRARNHDLLIVRATPQKGLRRIFSGSLANGIVANCRNPVFAVYPGTPPENTDAFEA